MMITSPVGHDADDNDEVLVDECASTPVHRNTATIPPSPSKKLRLPPLSESTVSFKSGRDVGPRQRGPQDGKGRRTEERREEDDVESRPPPQDRAPRESQMTGSSPEEGEEETASQKPQGEEGGRRPHPSWKNESEAAAAILRRLPPLPSSRGAQREHSVRDNNAKTSSVERVSSSLASSGLERGGAGLGTAAASGRTLQSLRDGFRDARVRIESALRRADGVKRTLLGSDREAKKKSSKSRRDDDAAGAEGAAFDPELGAAPSAAAFVSRSGTASGGGGKREADDCEGSWNVSTPSSTSSSSSSPVPSPRRAGPPRPHRAPTRPLLLSEVLGTWAGDGAATVTTVAATEAIRNGVVCTDAECDGNVDVSMSSGDDNGHGNGEIDRGDGVDCAVSSSAAAPLEDWADQPIAPERLEMRFAGLSCCSAPEGMP